MTTAQKIEIAKEQLRLQLDGLLDCVETGGDQEQADLFDELIERLQATVQYWRT